MSGNMSKVGSLLHKDMLGIYRDSFMLFLLGYALVLTVIMRLIGPWVPIPHIVTYLAPAVIMTGSLLPGMVLGFSLIEEREYQTAVLLRVLPMSAATLFGYFITTSSTLALITSLTSALLYGFPIANLPLFFVMTTISALIAPLVMLFLGVAASNKLEGFALGKIVSSSLFVPVLVFMVPLPWQLLLGWHPMYWIYLGLLQAYVPEEQLAQLAVYWPDYPVWLVVLMPLVLSLAGMFLLLRMYQRRGE